MASLDSLLQVNDTLAVHGSLTFGVLVPYRASFRFMCEHAYTGMSDPIPLEILHDHPPVLVEDVLVQSASGNSLDAIAHAACSLKTRPVHNDILD